MKASLGPRKIKKNTWFLPLLLITISILFEMFIKDYLYDISRRHIIYLQDKITIKGEKFSKSNHLIVIITRIIIHISSSNLLYFLISSLLYNFLNVYKIFILFLSILISNFFSSIFCYIFHSPRPFMVDSKISPLIFISSEWGSPNTQIVTLITFFLTLFTVIIRNKYMKDAKKLKIFIGIIFSILTLFFIFLYFFAGVVSYDQIVFSFLLGIICYLLMFSLFDIDFNNPKQLYIIVRFKFLYYVPLNVFLGIFLFILYKYIINDEEISFYQTNINKQISRYQSNNDDFFSSKIIDSTKGLFNLNNGIFFNILCFYCNIPIILGLKAEYISTFNKKFNNWAKSNFGSYDALTNFSMYNDYKYSEDSQWNNTGIFKTIIRIIISLILCFICLLPMYIPEIIKKYNTNQKEVNQVVALIFYSGFPLFLISFGTFYFFKVIYRILFLTKKFYND